MSQSKSETKSYFDKNASIALKGVAICLMMLHHCFKDVDLFSNYTVSFYPFRQDWIVGLADMAKICVSLFAFISGYGLYLSYKAKKDSPTAWVAKRYVKTFSGYWFVFVFCIIITFFLDRRPMHIFVWGDKTIWEAITHFGINFLGLSKLFRTRTLIVTWWYMSAAFVFIILTPLFVKFEEHLYLVLIYIIVLPRLLLGRESDVVFLGSQAAYSFLVPYLLGMIFAKYGYMDRMFGAKGKWIRLVVELLTLAFCYKVYLNTDIEYFWEIKLGLSALVFILLCVEFVIPIPGVKQVLQFLGKHSMNIFLVHSFIRSVYLEDFVYGMKHFVLIMVVLLVLSLLVSILLELIKKIIKYDTWIQTIFGKLIKAANL